MAYTLHIQKTANILEEQVSECGNKRFFLSYADSQGSIHVANAKFGFEAFLAVERCNKSNNIRALSWKTLCHGEIWVSASQIQLHINKSQTLLPD